MNIVAIDPGNKISAVLFYTTATSRRVLRAEILANDDAIKLVAGLSRDWHMAIEMVESFGMAVGAEVFETVWWTGRFCEAWSPRQFTRIYRKNVKLHLCRSPRAKDPNIRQALIDRFGGKEAAIGCKARPGPLYGVKSHLWSALAVAVTFADQAGGGPAA